LGIIANQSFARKGQLFYWNTQLNHGSNDESFVYFNSNINTEFGTSFRLFKKINASYSISYNSVNLWYRQVGVRQSTSILLNKRIDINLFVDVRKNLKVYQPLLFGLVHGEVGVHYLLNKE
jgi:hypothetical protein